jgi:hypothetical protein
VLIGQSLCEACERQPSKGFVRSARPFTVARSSFYPIHFFIFINRGHAQPCITRAGACIADVGADVCGILVRLALARHSIAAAIYHRGTLLAKRYLGAFRNRA